MIDLDRPPKIKLRNRQPDLTAPLEMSDGTPVMYVETLRDIIVAPIEGHEFKTSSYTYKPGAHIGIDKDTFKHVASDAFLRNRDMSKKFAVGETYKLTTDGYNAKILAEVRKPAGTILLVGFVQQGEIGSNGLIVPMIWKEQGVPSHPVPTGYSAFNLKPLSVPGQEDYEAQPSSVREAIVQVAKNVRLVTPATNAIRGLTNLDATAARVVLEYAKTL